MGRGGGGAAAREGGGGVVVGEGRRGRGWEGGGGLREREVSSETQCDD